MINAILILCLTPTLIVLFGYPLVFGIPLAIYNKHGKGKKWFYWIIQAMTMIAVPTAVALIGHLYHPPVGFTLGYGEQTMGLFDQISHWMLLIGPSVSIIISYFCYKQVMRDHPRLEVMF